MAYLAAAYLAILVVTLITGAAGADGGRILRTRSPEGYWVMVGTHGLAGFSALITAVVA